MKPKSVRINSYFDKLFYYDVINIIPLSSKYCYSETKSLVGICPSAHKPAVFWTMLEYCSINTRNTNSELYQFVYQTKTDLNNFMVIHCWVG